MRRTSSLAAAALAAALVASLGCDDNGTSPSLPPLVLRVDAPVAGSTPHPADDVVLVGEATASDVGLLPADSIWWTDNGVEVGRGRSVVRRVTEGAHDFVLHAQYGARHDSAAVRITTAGEGIGRVLWTAPLDSSGGDALSMGPGGVLYTFEDRAEGGPSLVAVGPDGAVRWRTQLDGWLEFSFPIVGPDGTVYVGTVPGLVTAIAPDGTRRWTFATYEHAPGPSTYYWVWGSPAVGADGTVYFGSEENDRPIYAVRPDGTMRWRTPTAPSRVCTNCDRIYGPVTLVGDSLAVVVRRGGSVAAVATSTGEMRWSMQLSTSTSDQGFTNGFHNPPAVSADGDIYVNVADVLARVRPSGTLAWRHASTAHYQNGGGPAIGDGGRLYLQGGGGALVLSPGGDSLATFGGTVGQVHGTPTLGANDVMYLSAGSTLYSFDRSGALRFAVPARARAQRSALPYPLGGPVVGPDGTVYLRTVDRGIIAIRDTIGPATAAAWPTLQGGAKRNGRRTTP